MILGGTVGTIRVVHARHPLTIPFLCLCGLFAWNSAGCGTVELGDNFVPPDPMIDEDFFYCRIQPEIINAYGCASGLAGENGSCHSARSALRLEPAAETAPPPECDGDALIGMPPDSWQRNLEAVRFTVRSDPTSSPFWRRPLGLDSHPRVIFPEGSPESDLIIAWILSGGT